MRAGLRYYPKLVGMVPFTPATGRRFLYAPDADPDRITQHLIEGAMLARDRTGASSIHLNFMNAEEATRVQRDERFMRRLGTQFHFHNHTYADFDAHLATFRSSVRKEVRKERRRVAESGLRVSVVPGNELSDAAWSALADFYVSTCMQHGTTPYLTRAFFDEIRKTHARRVIAVLAEDEQRIVAGTLNFEKGRHLYGRYWGALAMHDSLHFELCYHRLIERAIEQKQVRFEAGAQGIHKLKRGLLPSPIYSACHVHDGRLAAAASGYLMREAQAVEREMAELTHHGPSRRGEDEPKG
jgi:predicted N-acyltransferase